jgi:hypothetical protein
MNRNPGGSDDDAEAREEPNTPDPEKLYVAVMPFATDTRTVAQGERLRGDDPFVTANPDAFYEEGTPPEQRPNLWDFIDDPPEFEHPNVIIPASIAPHRQVESLVNVWFDGGHAPGSPGAASGRPSGFGTALRIGQVLDALDPIVRQNPGWFRWPARDVRLEDIEHLERLEGDA